MARSYEIPTGQLKGMHVYTETVINSKNECLRSKFNLQTIVFFSVTERS